ncbi:MAG: MFS transporter [Planctomycetaceae bacterium]|nr:MFS transporter [Planctomycetaceae bacterium]
MPLLPRYGACFNASKAQLGLLMASFSAMQFLFAPMWGALSDRVGRRPILMLGLLGSTFSYALFGYASSLGREGHFLGLGALALLFTARIGAGIAGATISTAQAVIADCTGVENRGRGMAMIGAAFGLGFTFGPLIGAACTSDRLTVALNDQQYAQVQQWDEVTDLITADQLLEELGGSGKVPSADEQAIRRQLDAPMPRVEVKLHLLEPPTPWPGYVASILSGCALLIAAWRLKETRRPPETLTEADAEKPVSAHGRRSWLNLRLLSTYLAQASLSAILLSVFITTFGFAQFESTLSLLTREFAFGQQSNFLLYAYVGVILSLGQGLLVRRFLPRIGEYRMALIGVTLMTTGFLLIGLTGDKVLPAVSLWYILPVVVIGFSAVTPSLQSLLSQAAPSDQQGSVLGTSQSLSALARILGPYTGIQLLGVSTSLPYYLGAGLIMAGGVMITRIRRAK